MCEDETVGILGPQTCVWGWSLRLVMIIEGLWHYYLWWWKCVVSDDAAMNLLKEEVVAIVGPQTSVVSHFVSHMGTATHVPLISFSATDPSLSEEQYPYFVRLVHSDDIQMYAIAGTVYCPVSWLWTYHSYLQCNCHISTHSHPMRQYISTLDMYVDRKFPTCL